MLSTVFYNQQRSGYEELLSYGPLFYRDLLEMDTNYRFAGKTLDVGAEGLEKLMQDQFIDTADEETISRWEKWLNLLPDSQTDLEYRRKRVKLFWNGGDKFSGSLIKSIVKNYTGCDETPSVRMTTRLTISVQIKEENQVYISDLEALIEKMKPAHILAEVLLISTTKIKFHTNITPIFQRTNKGIILTSEGEEFLGYARQVITQTSLMEERYSGAAPVRHQF